MLRQAVRRVRGQRQEWRDKPESSSITIKRAVKMGHPRLPRGHGQTRVRLLNIVKNDIERWERNRWVRLHFVVERMTIEKVNQKGLKSISDSARHNCRNAWLMPRAERKALSWPVRVSPSGKRIAPKARIGVFNGKTVKRRFVKIVEDLGNDANSFRREFRQIPLGQWASVTRRSM